MTYFKLIHFYNKTNEIHFKYTAVEVWNDHFGRIYKMKNPNRKYNLNSQALNLLAEFDKED